MKQDELEGSFSLPLPNSTILTLPVITSYPPALRPLILWCQFFNFFNQFVRIDSGKGGAEEGVADDGEL